MMAIDRMLDSTLTTSISTSKAGHSGSWFRAAAALLLAIGWAAGLPDTARAQFPQTFITDLEGGASDVHAADLDGDGDTDVLAAFTRIEENKNGPNSTGLMWFENDGTGGFTPHRIEPFGTHFVHAADVNGDGDIDIITGDRGGIDWYENDGTEAFTKHEIASVQPSEITVSDLDGDGDEDITTTFFNTSDSTLRWYENDGDGKFTAHTLPAETSFPSYRDVVTADFDGDGDEDLAVAGDAGLTWYENDGDESFAAHAVGGKGVSVLATADVDSDGDVDLVGESGDLRWFDNDGSGNFFERRVPISDKEGGDVQAVAARDVTGNGHLDFLVGETGDGGADQIILYENDGTPTDPFDGGWGRQIVSKSELSIEAVEAADLDGDGDRDALTAGGAGSHVAWHEQTSNGFTTHALLDRARDVRHLRTADVDGDGEQDVVAGVRTDRKIVWYEQKGPTTYGGHAIALNVDGVSGATLRVADVDGDGDPDVLATPVVDVEQSCSATGCTTNKIRSLVWYENDETPGQGRWTAHPIVTEPTFSFAPGDVDKDGDVDLYVSELESASVLNWYENEGGGTFTEHEIAKGTRVTNIRAADLSGNDSLDVLGRVDAGPNSFRGVGWFENQNGTFSERREIDPESSIRDLHATDFGGDGNTDVLFASNPRFDPRVVGVFKNQGDETFSLFPDTLIARSVRAVHVADFNGDALPDLFVGKRGTPDEVSWYENVGDATVVEHQITRNLDNLLSVQAADLDGDGVPDGVSGSSEGVSVYSNRLPQTAVIASVRPRNGAPGTPVRITGTGFDPTASNNDVTIGGASAMVDSATTKTIFARVPSGASGPSTVSVTSGGATVEAASKFTVTNKGDAAFTPVHTGLSGSVSDWGDFDDDGDLDAVTADGTIYENQGNGHFAPLDTGLSGGGGMWADVDNDGDLDVLGTNVVYLNQGGGSFTAKKTGLDLPADIEDIGDIDGDGDLDYLTSGPTARNRPKLYRNDGEGSFERISSFDPFHDSRDAELGDYDGDGDLDVLSGGDNGGTVIFENEGDGTFTPVETGLPEVDRGGMIEWADFDGDGDLDVARAGETARSGTLTHIYENKPDTLVRVEANLPGVQSGQLEWGDYNGDGNPDLLISGRVEGTFEDTTVLARNEGDGTFTARGPSETGLPADASISPSGDYDSDGDLDVAASLREGVALYRNGPSAFSLPVPPTDVAAGPADTGVRVDWGPSPSSEAARYHVFRSTSPIDSLQGLATLSPMDTTAAIEYVDSTAQTGTTYYYRITTLDTEGHESGFSGEAQAAPAGQETILVTVRTDAGDARQLTVGLDPAATAGQDEDLGETERPPLPPSDAFDARLIDDDVAATGFGEGLALDLREGGTVFRGEKTHELRVQPGSAAGSVTIETDLPYGVIGVLEDVSTGGDTVRDTLKGSASRTIEDLSLQKFTLTLAYRVPAATQTKTISADGTVDFPDSGVKLDVSGASGQGEVTVERFDFGPDGTSGTGSGTVLDARVTIGSVGNLRFDTTRVAVAVEALPPVADPEAVTMYRRPEAGTGSFEALATTHDEGGTPDDLSDDTLSAPVTAFSEFAFTTTEDVSPPDVPTGLTATAEADTVELGWVASDSSDVGKYRIYRDTAPIDSSAGPSGLTALYSTTAGTTAYADTTGQVGTRYYYRVTAVDTAQNESGFSVEATAAPKDATPPAVPSGLAAVAGDRQVRLGWDANSEADLAGYRLYRDTASFADPSEVDPVVDTLITGTSFTDTGLTNGQTYHYRVAAVDTASNESALSAEVQKTTAELVASDTSTVASEGSVPFEGASTSLAFSGVSGSGEVTVNRFAGEPDGTDGIPEENVSEDRLTIQAGSGLSFDSAAVRLAVRSLVGINDPANVTIYKRDNVGIGTFSVLETSVDDNGTPGSIDDDTLETTTESFSEFVLASDTEPLPVELASFEARTKEEAVRLQWTTASETGNAGFRVQRRVVSNLASGEQQNGSESEDVWSTVGSVEGAGTTAQAQSYRHVDRDLPYADTLTYRLKQVDAGGSASYTDEITVERSVQAVELLGTFPNPAQQRATVQYALPEKQDVTIRLYDVLGRRVRTVVDDQQEGRQERSLDVSRLSSGVYFLRLRSEREVRTQKVTVVR